MLDSKFKFPLLVFDSNCFSCFSCKYNPYVNNKVYFDSQIGYFTKL